MTIDTLAYAKHLENAGVPRAQAEALAEGVNRYIVPDLATKDDLKALEASITMRTLGIVAALDGLLFAALKLT